MNSNNMFNKPSWSNAGLCQLSNSESHNQHWRYFIASSVRSTSNQYCTSVKKEAPQKNWDFGNENKHLISDKPFKKQRGKHNYKKDSRTVRNLEGLYMIIHNIPCDFRSDDLRIFFSQFIETGGFVCFHFMRRGEIQTNYRRRKSSCCVIKVDPQRASELIEAYNGVPWVDRNGTIWETKCCIKKIIVDDLDPSVQRVLPYQRNKSNYKIRTDCDKFCSSDLERLPEIRPPRYMPNGNVGTNLGRFQELDEAGELPAKMRQRLGLGLQSNEEDYLSQDKKLTEMRASGLHNNVTERKSIVPKWILIKERRKFEKLRRALEKSSSGSKKEKVEAVRLDEFAAFEKYSNGFGRKLMEAQGWKQGQGIGKDGSGLSEPLGCDGQKPTVKKGLGYRHKEAIQTCIVKTEPKDSDESEIPSSASAVNSQEIKQESASTHMCNSKMKFKKEFIKGEKVVSFIYV